MKIAIFTAGKNVPSSRFRIQQHIKYLEKKGAYVKEFSTIFGKYPPKIKFIRPFWGLAILFERFIQVLSIYKYDVVFFQREMISKLCIFENIIKKPKILDIDDAVFLKTKAIDKIANKCDLIICGNKYLESHFKNKNTVIIPTAVDTWRFINDDIDRKDKVVIGWSGSSSGLKYVYMIEKVLIRLQKEFSNLGILIISNEKPNFKGNLKYNFEYWSNENEVKDLRKIDIGIMPLEDNLWEKGKCSYKMLLYMSMGLPVVVSSVGMNEEVLQLGNIGYGIKNNNLDDWYNFLKDLILKEDLRKEMGVHGRYIVEKCFSKEIISNEIYEEIIKIYSERHKRFEEKQ